MNLRKTLTIMVAVSMVLALAFTAEARPFGPGHKGRGMRGDLGGLKMLLELKLSDTQQAQMTNIINKYQKERETLRDTTMQARKNLSAVLRAEQFNEEQARKAFREASAARENMFVSRAKMMAELKAVLTPEQLESLKERKAQRIERMRHRFKTRLEDKTQ